MAHHTEPPKYPLLEAILALRQMTLQPIYTNQDVAKLFCVSVRAIQDRVASGQLVARNLPGRGRFFPMDLEEFLRNSRRSPRNEVP
jgi:hypothetical protein